jgi:hypothetical protein
MDTKFTFLPADKLKVQILEQEICPPTFKDNELRTDVHIVTYTVAGETYYDAVRAYTKVDIFDAYYDKLKSIGTIKDIKSGLGKIRPNLYGKIKS